ncbi:MAG: 3-phosphoserine/phosphohydroxythreonine transaminase [Fretibacterium sp.]|nr:3-phosphoserine/phosphohydroxythreonine transaminase [Fretibacterium sp.]
MEGRVYNFSAGPAMLPEPVLKQAAAEMLNCGGSGMSVMEMSHRSKDFEAILDSAEADLRELMGIPQNYHVLFLQGGGCTQFAMVPMNLMRNRTADYIVSGQWSKKASAEARLFGQVNIIASSEGENFSRVPDLSNLPVSPDADYVYLCQNETIHGTTIRQIPDTKGKPLAADISSMFLSEPLDVSRYGLLFAGAQKNAGPAGVTVVIIRDDLVREDVLPGTPTMMRYKTHADTHSLYNTPPCWGIYICGLVFKWLKELGGLTAMRERNEKKAALLYQFLDRSGLFHGTVRKQDRSLMNVPFLTGDKALDDKFVAESEAAGLRNLKGHRSVGGMRASLYNAVPYEAVEKLLAFMEKFEKENG